MRPRTADYEMKPMLCDETEAQIPRASFAAREYSDDEDGDGPYGTEAEGVAYAETLAAAERAADERLRAAAAACPLAGQVARRGEHVEYLTKWASPPERAKASTHAPTMVVGLSYPSVRGGL